MIADGPGHLRDRGHAGSLGCVFSGSACVWWLKTQERKRSHVERAGRDQASGALDRVDSGAILVMGDTAGI